MSTATLTAAIIRSYTQHQLNNDDVAWLLHVIENQSKPISLPDTEPGDENDS